MRRSEINSTYIVSPLNYIGGKARILDQILPHFPNDIDIFVDLFCGGCNVGANTTAKQYIYNDKNNELIGLLKVFKRLSAKTIIKKIDDVVTKYGFSRTSEHCFAYYGGNCMKGVSVYNREKFIQLRDDFNSSKLHNIQHYILLYSLIVFGFNNQLRFNNRGEYNLPVGKRDFNDRLKEKLSAFIGVLHKQDSQFLCKDFSRFDISKLTPQSLVYADPPYLISDATYNENDGWSEQEEIKLLAFLDKLNSLGIKFALSNVLQHKGRTNVLLVKWLEEHQYNVHDVSMDYSNSNYQVQGKDSGTQEVLITNF